MPKPRVTKLDSPAAVTFGKGSITISTDNPDPNQSVVKVVTPPITQSTPVKRAIDYSKWDKIAAEADEDEDQDDGDDDDDDDSEGDDDGDLVEGNDDGDDDDDDGNEKNQPQTTSGKYVPPHQRPRAVDPSQISEALVRTIKSQLNKLTERNLHNVVTDIRGFYTQYPHSHVNTLLSRFIIDISCR